MSLLYEEMQSRPTDCCKENSDVNQSRGGNLRHMMCSSWLSGVAHTIPFDSQSSLYKADESHDT